MSKYNNTTILIFGCTPHTPSCKSHLLIYGYALNKIQDGLDLVVEFDIFQFFLVKWTEKN